MAAQRESKRPSRAGLAAGSSTPDLVLAELVQTGFDARLVEVLEQARRAVSVTQLLDVLLTLDGDLPERDGLRALDRLDAAVVATLRYGGARLVADYDVGGAAFVADVGLDPVGRFISTSPLRRDFGDPNRRAGMAARMVWTSEGLVEFARRAEQARVADQTEVRECRAFLSSLDDAERLDLVDRLRLGLLSVPPVQLVRGRRVLSNLRDETNLTGKTLSPHSPQCFFTDLGRLPLSLWSDDEAVVVTCLWITYRSGGVHRIESMNGAQLDLDRVWENFVMVRDEYARAFVPCDPPDLDLARPSIEMMLAAAAALNAERSGLVARRALAHRLLGATRSKREFALPAPEACSPEEAAIAGRLAALVPGAGGRTDLAGIRTVLAGNPWLLEPADPEPSGLEAVIATTVEAAVEAFDADFALSRGVRNYPDLVRALLERDFADVVRWELPAYYCCVVPSSAVAEADSHPLPIADVVWSMAARMQYNTWHVLPGNLPKDATAAAARDFFAPQTLPDVADNMDFFHRGHIVAAVKHTLRSPEPVEVNGCRFNSLTDLRLARTGDRAFTPRELSVVMRIARFLADTLQDLAAFCVLGRGIAITSFDSPWHRSVTERKAAAHQ